jgi:hypothetical protein
MKASSSFKLVSHVLSDRPDALKRELPDARFAIARVWLPPSPAPPLSHFDSCLLWLLAYKSL